MVLCFFFGVRFHRWPVEQGGDITEGGRFEKAVKGRERVEKKKSCILLCGVLVHM